MKLKDTLKNTLSIYMQSLRNTSRKPDFIYNKREYYETKDEPRLRGLVFYLQPEKKTIIFDIDPRGGTIDV